MIKLSDIMYTYPVDQIDQMIQLIDSGQKPFGMTDILRNEIELRRKELRQMAAVYEDELDDDTSLEELHQRMTAKIEANRRKATIKKDAPFRKLSAEDSAELREQMETSVVRNNGDSVYNKTDAELYTDAEAREIMMGLKSIRSRYSDPISWAAAFKRMLKGIEWSLHHDYPMGYDWAVQEFNAGRIKYKYGPVPQLWLGPKRITDRRMLHEILNGNVQVVNRKEEEAMFAQKKRKRGKPVNVEYGVVSPQEYASSVARHNRGMDSTLGVALKSQSSLFDRLSVPFSIGGMQQKKDVIQPFDWTQPDAGRIYFNLINDIRVDKVSEMFNALNAQNGNRLNQTILQNMRDFETAANHPELTMMPTGYSSAVIGPLAPTEKAQQIEAEILKRIRSCNVQLMSADPDRTEQQLAMMHQRSSYY